MNLYDYYEGRQVTKAERICVVLPFIKKKGARMPKAKPKKKAAVKKTVKKKSAKRKR